MLVRRSASLALVAGLSGCTLVGYPAGTGRGATPVSPGGSQHLADPGAAPASRPSDAGRSYEVFGVTYHVLNTADGYVEEGLASWYGEGFDGRPTASGETFDMHRFTAAHRTLPLHTWIEVTNLDNGREVVLRVNDRGPFAHTDTRIVDLSYGAARELDMIGTGMARVRVRALSADEVSRLR